MDLASGEDIKIEGIDAIHLRYVLCWRTISGCEIPEARSLQKMAPCQLDAPIRNV